jgi:predicted site-specific integrase-resolvase
MAHNGSVEWVRAADAARMLGVSRERVRQLIEAGALTCKQEPKRRCWVLVADIEARLAGR